MLSCTRVSYREAVSELLGAAVTVSGAVVVPALVGVDDACARAAAALLVSASGSVSMIMGGGALVVFFLSCHGGFWLSGICLAGGVHGALASFLTFRDWRIEAKIPSFLTFFGASTAKLCVGGLVAWSSALAPVSPSAAEARASL